MSNNEVHVEIEIDEATDLIKRFTLTFDTPLNEGELAETLAGIAEGIELGDE